MVIPSLATRNPLLRKLFSWNYFHKTLETSQFTDYYGLNMRKRTNYFNYFYNSCKENQKLLFKGFFVSFALYYFQHFVFIYPTFSYFCVYLCKKYNTN